MMDSSFLFWFHLLLTIFLILGFLKLVTKFGISNQPHFHLFFITIMSSVAYLSLEVFNFLSILRVEEIDRWQAATSHVVIFGILIQLLSQYSAMPTPQLRALSRLPLMWGLIVFGFLSSHSAVFFVILILVTIVTLVLMPKELRLLKRHGVFFFIFLMIIMANKEYGFGELGWFNLSMILVMMIEFYRLQKLMLLRNYISGLSIDGEVV